MNTQLTQIEALTNLLTELGWKPKVWEAHGKVRIYCNVSMGKKFSRGGKCFFDYENTEDAKEIFDNTLPVIFGAAFKVWHDNYNVKNWAFTELKRKFISHLEDNNINYKYNQ